MRLQRVVQDMVWQVEQRHRANGKQGYEIIGTYARTQSEVDQIAYHSRRERHLQPDNIERDDILGEQKCQDGNTDGVGYDMPELFLVT